jgi:hypothetical protein
MRKSNAVQFLLPFLSSNHELPCFERRAKLAGFILRFTILAVQSNVIQLFTDVQARILLLTLATFCALC